MKKLYVLLMVLGGFLFMGNVQPAHALYRPLAGPPGILEMKLREFIRLSARDFCRLTDTKMSLKASASFSVLKWQMKKTAKKNPDMTVSQYMASSEKKNNTGVIIVLAVVVVIIVGIIVAKSIGPGSIDWGEGG